jgi:hypothetical protein
MAPLIERNASTDTFCLLLVNNFYSRAGAALAGWDAREANWLTALSRIGAPRPYHQRLSI